MQERRLTEDDARESLTAHVEAKGAVLRATYGPHIGWHELVQILEDRSVVRYPCEIVFDDAELQPGECAYPAARSEHPEDGFVLYVHPAFSDRPGYVPHVVLYQLVRVNYGEFASADDAETFGASALGLSKDAYYRLLCELSDDLVSAYR
jgi:hypothetical protein